MQYVQIEGGSMTGKAMSMDGECNLCGKVNLSEFVDGATRIGPWANMCMPCFKRVGKGLGVGRGQRYAMVVNHVSGSMTDTDTDMRAKAHAAQAHMRAKAALFADVWDKGEPTE
jgi:hypothetical protein